MMPAMNPFISLENITIRLYGKLLFPETTWEIRSDQHWVVIGANGSGKSTLVKALCGNVPIVGGRIRYHFFEDQVPGEGIARRGLPQDHIERVSFDAQERVLEREGGFYQARWNSLAQDSAESVSECLSEEQVFRINPFEVRENRGDPALFEKRREEVIDLLEIRTLLDRRLIQLSNGEMRKTIIARALLRRPSLLILDNPFEGLDIGFRSRLRQILRNLMEGPMRLIIVTSRLEDIPEGVTHALLVKGHRAAAMGPAREILEDSSARYLLEERLAATGTRKVARDSLQPADRVEFPVLVEMHEVSVRYEGVMILEDIDWMVRKGENWVLLGPNGSGKSTLLSLILGDNPQAYANRIFLFGKRRGSGESIWDIKQRIGYVSPELQAYYPKGISCYDVVCSGFFDSLGLYRLCSSDQRRRADQWMEQLGIGAYRKELLSGISEGEQRMILLARALVKRPLLLILDEPCQGLDDSNRRRILGIIEDAATHLDTTVIYVTHNRKEIPGIITHEFHLEKGRGRGGEIHRFS